jgi:hypothetical protein
MLQVPKAKIEDAVDEPGCGYSLAEENLWSPDGKYFIIYHEVYSGSNPQQDDRLYVDCENGVTVGFGTVKGTSAGLSNCNDEWVKGKPHSLSVSENNGKYAESLPPH